jgi:sporulation protein YlmC with PRC-barrel domain
LLESDVLDSSGKKIGHIDDLTFKFDGALILSKFIMAGSVFEEILETIGVRPDEDPVFDASLIKKIDGRKIQLNTTADGLKTTLDETAIGEEEIRWSDLTKMSIFDKNNTKIGNALDVDFDVDGTTMMIVGGGFIEEILEASGLKADVDILVPGGVIDSIEEKITLGVSKDKLDKTMQDALKSKEQRSTKSTKDVTRDISKVRLFTQRPY